MSNKDILLFDFVRAANQYLRDHHRRCDDPRGTNKPDSGSEMDEESRIQYLQDLVSQYANRVKALEADLEVAKKDYSQANAELQTLLTKPN